MMVCKCGGRLLNETQPFTHDLDIYCLNCGKRAVDVTNKLDGNGFGTKTIGSPMNYQVQYVGAVVPA